MGSKQCTKCKEIKPFSEFGKDRNRGEHGLTYQCKACRNPQAKKWRDENPEKVKLINKESKAKRKEYYDNPERKLKYRSLELKRAFGLTHEDYEKMLAEQNGVCKICKRYRTASNKNHMAIDHCHKTGKIRGILCNWCNRGLGVFEDNLEFLENAKIYLLESKKDEK